MVGQDGIPMILPTVQKAKWNSGKGMHDAGDNPWAAQKSATKRLCGIASRVLHAVIPHGPAYCVRVTVYIQPLGDGSDYQTSGQRKLTNAAPTVLKILRNCVRFQLQKFVKVSNS
jgi:hypothetical protein